MVVPIKSKGVAYLLWFFLGIFGAHKFYLEKIGMGILYLCTGGLFFVGWIVDLFTLGNQVDLYNALHGGQAGGGGVQANNQTSQSQNIVVNVAAPAPTPVVPSTSETIKISAEKQILALSEKDNTLSIKQIVSHTSLDLKEAEDTIKILVEKGIAKEQVSPNGKVYYDFS